MNIWKNVLRIFKKYLGNEKVTESNKTLQKMVKFREKMIAFSERIIKIMAFYPGHKSQHLNPKIHEL